MSSQDYTTFENLFLQTIPQIHQNYLDLIANLNKVYDSSTKLPIEDLKRVYDTLKGHIQYDQPYFGNLLEKLAKLGIMNTQMDRQSWLALIEFEKVKLLHNSTDFLPCPDWLLRHKIFSVSTVDKNNHLTQSDLDVLFAIIELHLISRYFGSAYPIDDYLCVDSVTTKGLLAFLVRRGFTMSLNGVEKSLDLLSNYVVDVPGYFQGTFLLKRFTNFDDNFPLYGFNPDFITQLNARIHYIDNRVRLKLKGSFLAKWLHGVYSSFKEKKSFNTVDLLNRCGSTVKDVHVWEKRALKEGLEFLEKAYQEVYNTKIQYTLGGGILTMELPQIPK